MDYADMSMSKFFSQTRNLAVTRAWCSDGPMRVYLRNEGYNILSITNLYNSLHMRRKNCFFDPNHQKTGMFAPFMDRLERGAWDAGFRMIYFGGVANEFLPEVLERRGYERKPGVCFGLPRYVLLLGETVPA